MKIIVTMEINIRDCFCLEDEDGKSWFENNILNGDSTLYLHSSKIGDTVGIIKKVENIKYIKQ